MDLELSTIDHLFARTLLPDGDETMRMQVAKLMAAARLGHLCVPLESMLPSSSLEEVSELTRRPKLPFCLYEGNLYLQKNWLFESAIVHSINQQLKESVTQLEVPTDVVLTEQQSGAVIQAATSSISIITGGPGTGKTYTASKIVSSFLTAMPDARVILAAPTGKAAAKLESGIENRSNQIESSTLHSLLKIRFSTDFSQEASPIFADLIIVDEASMIDVKLFAYFLSAVQSDSHLVLMGDRDQLPPVEAGSIFADLVDAALAGYPLPCTLLTKCLRSDRSEILHLAQRVKDGESLEVEPLPRSPEALVEILKERVVDEKFKLLSCTRKGPFGVDNLNRLFAKVLFEKSGHAPIMITRNDYNLGLFNGDCGQLVGEEAHFGERIFPAALLSSYEFGYCLSVHKSQGSEYEEVVVLIPPGSESFGREVLYTAITRAKESVRLIGDCEAANLATSRSARNRSGLCQRLR